MVNWKNKSSDLSYLLAEGWRHKFGSGRGREETGTGRESEKESGREKGEGGGKEKADTQLAERSAKSGSE